MVRSKDSKYCLFFSNRERREELFDLAQDPYERTHLADDPKYAGEKAKMRKVLMQHLKKTDDTALGGLVSIGDPIFSEAVVFA